MTLLVDTSYTVTCADETAAIDDANEANKMVPFIWDMSVGKFSDYYKGTEGNFAVGYIPIFTYISSSPDEALPVGETYAISGLSGDCPAGDETFNFWNSIITTVAFSDSGEMIAARSRNLTRADGTTLEQGWSNLVKSGNQYSMLNGEYYEGANRWFQDRKIEGFVRSSDFTSRQELSVQNGPDCGQNLGARNLARLTNPIASYWKRIRR